MVKFETIEQLLQFLAENRPGLFIKLWPYSATFLPSVWEELPDPEQFLIHLIYKAWLTPQVFVENFKDVEIYYYTGEEFGDRFKNI
jgi:AMMECR1 domain-containing protein